MNKSLKFSLGIIIIILVIISGFKAYYWLDGLGYKVANHKGRSRSILESEKRGVFFSRLSWHISNPRVKFKKPRKIRFFIEKAFRYGAESSYVTNVTYGKDSIPLYQLVTLNFEYFPFTDNRLYISGRLGKDDVNRYINYHQLTRQHEALIKLKEGKIYDDNDSIVAKITLKLSKDLKVDY